MPLDAERVAAIRYLQGLGQVVHHGPAGDLEPVADARNPLVVVRFRRVHELAGAARGQRSLRQADVVVGAVERAGRAAVVVVAEVLGQVLAQAAAEGDVDQLHAAADPQQRQVARQGAAREGHLEPVALGHGVDGLGVTLGVVDGGVDVGAADEHQAVDQVEDLVGPLGQRRVGRQQDGEAAGAVGRVDVVARQQRGGVVPHAPAGALPCGADANNGPIHDGPL